MRYRKKPVVIQAIQWRHGDDLRKIAPLMGPNTSARVLDDGYLYIQTPEGEMCANDGDWVIRGVQGELYPCKPDIFDQTYEAVEP